MFLCILFLAFVALTTIHISNVYDTIGTEDIALFINTIMERMTDTPFEISFTKSTITFLIVSMLFSLLLVEYYITSKKHYMDGKEYGSATWGKKKDIKHLVNKNDDKNMIFTDTEKTSISNYELNNNCLVIGGSGSGKTRGVVMPNILQSSIEFGSSFIITDPKGEILRKSGKYLTDINYRVVVLNLFEMHKSNYYNCFEYIDPNREEEVMQLIDSIMMNTTGDKSHSGDPFWEKAEQLFLQSIFYYISMELPKSEQSIPMVLELIRMAEIKEDEDFVSDLDKLMLVLEEEKGSNHIAVIQYKHFKVSAGDTLKSIIISASARLAPFNIPSIRNMTSHLDEFYIDKIGEEKTAVFVVLPPTSTTFNFIGGMLYTQILQQLNYSANAKHNGILPVPVRFILDEFYNTGKIPNFPNLISYARSLNVSLMPIVQSLEQLKSMYEKEWQGIMDNCAYMLYLGSIRNMETLKYISELLGKATIDKRNFNYSRGKQSSTTKNEDRVARDLMTTDELQVMKKNKCILFINGYRPFFSTKFRYKKHKRYKMTSDYSKKNLYEHIPYHDNTVIGYFDEKEIIHTENSTENVTLNDKEVEVNFKKKKKKLLDKLFDENSLEFIEDESIIQYMQENLVNIDFTDDSLYEVSEDMGWEKRLMEETIYHMTKEMKEEVYQLTSELTLEELSVSDIEIMAENKDNIDFPLDDTLDIKVEDYQEITQEINDIIEYSYDFQEEDDFINHLNSIDIA